MDPQSNPVQMSRALFSVCYPFLFYFMVIETVHPFVSIL